MTLRNIVDLNKLKRHAASGRMDVVVATLRTIASMYNNTVKICIPNNRRGSDFREFLVTSRATIAEVVDFSDDCSRYIADKYILELDFFNRKVRYLRRAGSSYSVVDEYDLDDFLSKAASIQIQPNTLTEEDNMTRRHNTQTEEKAEQTITYEEAVKKILDEILDVESIKAKIRFTEPSKNLGFEPCIVIVKTQEGETAKLYLEKCVDLLSTGIEVELKVLKIKADKIFELAKKVNLA